MKKKTHADQILDYLRRGWTCSQVLHGISWRYSARIHDLRMRGLEIESMECLCFKGSNFKHWRIVPKP